MIYFPAFCWLFEKSNPYLNELLGFLLTQMFLLKVAQKV